MKNTTDNIQNTNRGSNGGQTTISGASNPHKLRDSAQTMKLSPMMQEYCKTKEEYKDCILFYRLGDFYEMFFDDERPVFQTVFFEVFSLAQHKGFVHADMNVSR